MKKLFTLSIFSILTQLTFSQSQVQFIGQTDGQIELSCQIANYQVLNNGIYTSIRLDEGNPILRAGAPDVEQITTSVIVDDQAEMSVVVTHATFEEFHDVYIRPSKGNLLRTVDPETIPYQEGEAYSQDAFYPGALASLGKAYVQRQFRGQSVHFYPVQYNPVTHVLRVYSDIQVAVKPTENVGENPLSTVQEVSTNATFKEVYQGHFINYTHHADRYDQVSELGNMLVIADAMYMDELEPWVNWKIEKGIATEVVDVANFTNLAELNAFIENYYNTNGLTYLMLVGDEDQIPVQLLNNSGGQGYCDQCYGYISGNDSYSEILIGHFLVHTDSELPAMINKTLEYEKNPNTAIDWFSVAMGIGSNEGAGIGDDNQADWEHQNGLKEELLTYTYTNVYERYDGNHAGASPTPGSLSSDASGSPAASTLTAVIENGCSLINYTGHGAHNLIVTGSYTNTQINQLQNNGYYPYFIIVGCCTGDYDDDDASGDTFGEAWIKSTNANSPTGGIGGAFSSVYQSWAPPMEGQDEMVKIITETAAINTRHTFGSIHTHGCAGMNDVYGADGDEMTDTWILMGDATVQLRTAFPTQITASHPTSAFFGVTSITVACNTEDAWICLTMNGEIIATGLVAGGQAVLNFAPVTGPGSILVTATSFNTIPYQGYIELVPANGPFLVGVLNGINDAQGNGNGLADVTETIQLNADAENIGIEVASAVTATVTCANTFVVIDVANHTYGDVAAGSTISGPGAFTFHTTPGIADQTPVTFVVTYVDALGNTWTSNMIVVIQAPKFACSGGMTITEVNGNGNGRLDSGETIQLVVPVTNSGHAPTPISVNASMSTNSPYVSFVNATADLGVVQPGQTVNAVFTVEIALDAPNSSAADFTFTTNAGGYDLNCGFNKTINQVLEDWESGTDTQFPWAYSGNADWFVTNATVYEGAFSMQSGDIGNSQTSVMTLTQSYTSGAGVQFMYKVSSEAGYDELRFAIDNAQQDAWSGEVDWTLANYNVNAGTHTLKWTYFKDNIVSNGSDAAWVDNIIFDGIAASVQEQTQLALLNVFPNPTTQMASVLWSSGVAGMTTIRVLNALGELVHVISFNANAGNNRIELPMDQFAAGVYTVRVEQQQVIGNVMLVKQ